MADRRDLEVHGCSRVKRPFFQRSRSALVHNCQDSLQMQMQKQTRMHKHIDLKGFEVHVYGLPFF